MLKLFLAPLVTVFVANVIPFLTYRQNDNKNKVALMDTLARELDKQQPCGYLVESCLARLHNIRPLPWEFLRVVLPCSHSLEIIQLISTGRGILSLFDVQVVGNRPVVQYAAALSNPSRRRNTMYACFFICAFFIALFSYTEWQLLRLLSENSLPSNASDTLYGNVLYKVMLMLLWAAALFVFTLQGVILRRSEKRLSQIRILIADNFPAPPPGQRAGRGKCRRCCLINQLQPHRSA